MPKRRATLYRRQIAAVSIPPRVAQAHWSYGDAFFVVEGSCIDTEPLTQAVPGPVVEGHTAFVHPRAWRLPDYENAGRCTGSYDGSGAERKKVCAASAATGFLQQLLQRHSISRANNRPTYSGTSSLAGP